RRERNCPSRKTGKFVITQGALPGPDGLVGTSDDVINPADPPKTFTIPVSVTTALCLLGEPLTVGGLLDLANIALGGGDTKGASNADINQAVDAINEGFDECRFLFNPN